MNTPYLRVEPLTGRVGPRRVNDRLMALIMAGLLFTVGAVTLARHNEQITTAPPPSDVVLAARSLSFIDIHGGQIQILDADTGVQVAVLASGEGSFVRGVVRSLVRSRNLRHVSARSPFALALHQDGRLILTDPVTLEVIELQAFGPTNTQAFRALLPGPPIELADAHSGR